MTENRFCLTEEYEGERIDKVLVRLLEDTSRNYLKKLFADGSVQLNGKAVKPSARVKEGDEVWISIPDRVVPDILAEDIPLEVLYEDEDVLVVNKPKDMVVHPAAGHYSGTLVNAVMYRCRDQLSGINGVLRPGPALSLSAKMTLPITASRPSSRTIPLSGSITPLSTDA